ncbi:Aste57867_16341 [Aphanomyces stellatus]|uniref:Aste57867_16341 protein n=1 Tax=Aphanomyces stellatus TaxID=120398 RepID=A0A485L612_9STRA|nr:hypothetical protein As57867_016284 [Aphanomyces stellatus]VFT93117.1 Aste57867_16341 [Aphanomyces stellatus]
MRFSLGSLIERCNAHDRSLYLPLTIALPVPEPPATVGLVRKDRLHRLAPFRHVFDVDENELRLRPEYATEDQRTAAIQEVAKALKPETWKNEPYGAPRDGNRNNEPWFRVDRSASTFFGIHQYGCHLNGFVRHNKQSPHDMSIWLATRDASKAIHPGKLDSLVGGGLPWDLSPTENMLKEAEEEAGMSRAEAMTAMTAAGAISYVNDEPHGFKANTMFIFDMELPATWTPRNTDGEVARFDLWPADKVLDALRTTPDSFKPDICLVLVDFFIRHGLVTPDDFVKPGYDRVCAMLHPPIPLF